MNINMSMLKEGRGKVEDRLYEDNRNYLGQISKIDNTTGDMTLRSGIFYNNYNFKK